MNKEIEAAKMKAQDRLDELHRKVEVASKLPFSEAEEYLGIKKPTDNIWGRFLCRRGFHKPTLVPGAAHSEMRRGCERPSCRRLLDMP